jgi:hypothetical protein
MVKSVRVCLGYGAMALMLATNMAVAQKKAAPKIWT